MFFFLIYRKKCHSFETLEEEVFCEKPPQEGGALAHVLRRITETCNFRVWIKIDASPSRRHTIPWCPLIPRFFLFQLTRLSKLPEFPLSDSRFRSFQKERPTRRTCATCQQQLRQTSMKDAPPSLLSPSFSTLSEQPLRVPFLRHCDEASVRAEDAFNARQTWH